MILAEEMTFDVSERVATITFNRPEKMNSWTPNMETQFAAGHQRI